MHRQQSSAPPVSGATVDRRPSGELSASAEGGSMSSGNYDRSSANSKKKVQWEINFQEIILGEPLGQGEYGENV
jgi:hypothetical protein